MAHGHCPALKAIRHLSELGWSGDPDHQDTAQQDNHQIDIFRGVDHF